MRIIISLTMTIFLMITLVSCGEPKNTIYEDTYTLYEDMGFEITDPEGATDIVAEIQEDTILQLEFVYEEAEYVLRISEDVSDEDLHGYDMEDFEQYVTGSESDGIDFAHSISVFTLRDDKGKVATSTVNVMNEDTLYLSLFTTENNEEIESVISVFSQQFTEDMKSK